MTRDEICAVALAAGYVSVDAEAGTAYRHRGPGGNVLAEGVPMKGTLIKGYQHTTIKVGEIKKSIRIHRLVWIAVHGVPPVGLTIDHRDGDKSNNRISNLELVSAGENARRAHSNGQCNYKRKLDPDTDYQLIWLERQSSDLTIKQLADKYGVSHARIKQIVKGGPYPFQGTKSQRFLQVGNAVPPLLAKAILEALIPAELLADVHSERKAAA